MLSLIDVKIAQPGTAARIDLDGSPRFVPNPHKDVDLLNPLLKDEGWESYADCEVFRHRRPYERCLWLRRADGRVAPELLVLAYIKTGRVSGEAFWTDGDWTHNDIENVSVEDRVPGQRPVSKYGVRSTTSEYRKRYYADPVNKARQRKAARDHAARKRQELKEATAALPQDVLQELEEKILGPKVPRDDDNTETFQSPEVGSVLKGEDE